MHHKIVKDMALSKQHLQSRFVFLVWQTSYASSLQLNELHAPSILKVM